MDFPEAWLGLWKDVDGRVYYLERIKGRVLRVSFANGTTVPFSPLPWGGRTQGMTALFVHEAGNGFHVMVETGPPGIAPRLMLRFLYFEGDRARMADAGDKLFLVVMEPSVVADGDSMPWQEVCRHCQKADEEIRAFLESH
jgi:hypothetical protein